MAVFNFTITDLDPLELLFIETPQGDGNEQDTLEKHKAIGRKDVTGSPRSKAGTIASVPLLSGTDNFHGRK